MKLYSLLACCLLALGITATAETARLTVTPGQLKAQLLSYDGEPDELILSGSLNSADLTYINEGSGKMAMVNSIDLSAITLSYDNGYYAKIGGYPYDGDINGTWVENYYLSEINYSDTVYNTTPLGLMQVVVTTGSNNLAALLSGNQNIKKIVFPNAITEYGAGICFSSIVEEVTLPDATTSIPFRAFERCDIKTLHIKEIKSVGEFAFYQAKLTNFDFSHVNELGYRAFSRCILPVDVTLSGGVKVIDEECFSRSNIETLVIGSGTKEIGVSAFANCQLKTVTLPEGLEKIGQYAFDGNNALTRLNFPSTLTEVGAKAFPENFMNNVAAENGVVYIGKNAYALASNNGTIKIKEGITAISDGFDTNAGKYASTVTKITLPSTLETIGILSQNITSYYNSSNNEALGAFSNCSNLSEIEFATNSRLKIIGDESFLNCAMLKSVTIPEGVTTIGDFAFLGCKDVDFTLPQSLQIIGKEVFGDYYSSKNNVTIKNIPSGLMYIGDSAFRWCRLPSTVELGQSIREIGSAAFGGCTGVYQVKINLNKDCKVQSPFSQTGIDMLTVEAGCTYVPGSLFQNNTTLSIIKFEEPDATTPPLTIGDYAFSKCTALTLDELPMRVDSIGSRAFEYVKLPQEFSTGNVRYIGSEAFYGATGIETLVMAEPLEYCGSRAFAYITSLTNLKLLSHNLQYANGCFKEPQTLSVFVGQNVQRIPKDFFSSLGTGNNHITFESRAETQTPLTIESDAFAFCFFSKIIFPDTKTIIEDSAFMYSYVDGVQLGKGTESIGYRAFFTAFNVNEINIPASVTTIGDEAFKQVVALGMSSNGIENITFESRDETKTPLTIGKQAFYYTAIRSLELPDTETYIGDEAFSTHGDKNVMSTLRLGIGTKSIGAAAFSSNRLSYINVPSTVSFLGQGAFPGGIPVVFYSETAPTIDNPSRFMDGRTVFVPQSGLDSYTRLLGTNNVIPYGDDIMSFESDHIKVDENKTKDIHLAFDLPKEMEDMSWKVESSDPEIVTATKLDNYVFIDLVKNGTVRLVGKKEGTATVTAYLEYNPDIKAECTVSVGDFSTLSKFEFEQSEVYVEIDRSKQLNLIIEPEGAEYEAIKYTSSDPETVFVWSNGMVSGEKPGTATITAISGKYTATCQVTVTEPISLSLNVDYAEVFVGETLQMTVTITPKEYVNEPIEWESSSPQIATVDQNGLVTGVTQGGLVSIIASLTDNPNRYAMAFINVLNIEPTSINISPDGGIIKVGESIQLTAIVEPTNVTVPITWRVDNPEVANITEDGWLTGLSVGETYVEAWCGYLGTGTIFRVVDMDGVDDIMADKDNIVSVYTVDGILLKKDCTVDDLKYLAKGIYIIVSGTERFKVSL
ncbi:MAG: leucine-rich repeat protein [Muribaculaceae bacterium]|nr:leucine-rich repeat protein [Muribaculaceae bacterium]